ncbi:MAG: hypothetical protein LBS83_02735 [Holosporales bacterium]|jgi:hypothetical protein|nr:hypothetical protein [Holosporales bacterium]
MKRVNLYLSIVFLCLCSCSQFKQGDLPSSLPVEKSSDATDATATDSTIDSSENSNLEDSAKSLADQISSLETSKSDLKEETSKSDLKEETSKSDLKEENSPPVKPEIDQQEEVFEFIFEEKTSWVGKDLDSFSRQLAGLIPFKKKLSPETQNSFFQIINQGWENLKNYVLDPMNIWKEENKDVFDIKDSRIFYPFGGPDALYVTQLFPQAQEYIILGLESGGSISTIQSNLPTEKGIKTFAKSMENFFKMGFFVTEYMISQVSWASGVIPLFLAQLSKLGYNILEISEGTFEFKSNSAQQSEDKKLKGVKAVRIKFKGKNDEEEKTITYIRCDSENKNLRRLKSLFSFINEKPFFTFLKSSSYALHNSAFSKLREFILNNSSGVLQDDTGIPFRMIKKYSDYHLFGQYTQPALKFFQKFYLQKDLALSYKNENVKKLPFRFGYGCSIVPSNLIFAKHLTKKAIISPFAVESSDSLPSNPAEALEN